MQGIDFAALIADEPFESNGRADAVLSPSFPPRLTAKTPSHMILHRWRNLIENCFRMLNEFRRVATRYDKTDTNFAAARDTNDRCQGPAQTRAPISFIAGQTLL